MKLLPSLVLTAFAAPSAFAQESRELDAHEHGVGQLDIAIEGDQIAMELHAPGADIVGFEYEPESDDDLAAIVAAVEVLEQPLSLFALPDAAGCSVVEASAGLESEADHDDHDEHEEGENHDDHDEHEEGEDHADHDEHEEGDGHADHDDHDEHEDHADHDEHGDEVGHTEFHAEYLLTCANPDAVTEISFGYFAAFTNALELEVQVISATGAAAFEVERDEAFLALP